MFSLAEKIFRAENVATCAKTPLSCRAQTYFAIGNIGRLDLEEEWEYMARYENNLVVVGAGSAGLIASLIGATVRAKVVLIEEDRMGGDCLNTGCVPSKTLISSARVAHAVRHSDEFGINSSEVNIDFDRIMLRIRSAIKEIEPNDSIERYTELGVECIKGHAQLVDPHRVQVNGREISSRSIVLAIGAEPQIPPVPGLRESNPLTSENLWEIQELPKRLVVIGGGPIGCELAQAFARLGSEVSVVEQMDRLLPIEDDDVSNLIANKFKTEGIRVLTGHRAARCSDNQLTVVNGSVHEQLDFDRVLVATGRSPRGENMGLSEVGVVRNEDGSIDVNDYLQSRIRSIYACGDVVGPYQFTHMASHQAWYAAMNALLRPFWRFSFDSNVIAWTTFTDPEVARVGLNETQLKERSIPFEVTEHKFNEVDRAITDGSTEGFVKLLTKPKSDRLLGACIVGQSAGDLISSCINAMTHGYGMNKVLSTLHVYPTRTEAIRLASGSRRRKHAPEGLLRIAARLNGLLR